MKTRDFSARNYAVNIQLESLDPTDASVSFDTLLKVFNKFKISFRNFIEIEFLKDPYFSAIQSKKPRVLEDIKKETELAIVQLDIEKLLISIAPELKDDQDQLFQNEILCWKKEMFDMFRQNVIFRNYHDRLSIEKILTEYELTERIKIYKPIFDAISGGKNYKVNILGSSNKIIGMFIPPDDMIRKLLLSPVKLSSKDFKGFKDSLSNGNFD